MNTTKKPTSGMGKGVKEREEDRVDIANVIWSDVTGLCGFSGTVAVKEVRAEQGL